MIRLKEGRLLNGGILAARLRYPTLSVTAADRWTVTAERIEWIERGMFSGEERYQLLLPLASGVLAGQVAVRGETLEGKGALCPM